MSAKLFSELILVSDNLLHLWLHNVWKLCNQKALGWGGVAGSEAWWLEIKAKYLLLRVWLNVCSLFIRCSWEWAWGEAGTHDPAVECRGDKGHESSRPGRLTLTSEIWLVDTVGVCRCCKKKTLKWVSPYFIASYPGPTSAWVRGYIFYSCRKLDFQFYSCSSFTVVHAQLAREVLDESARAIKPGVTTDELDRIVHQVHGLWTKLTKLLLFLQSHSLHPMQRDSWVASFPGPTQLSVAYWKWWKAGRGLGTRITLQ